VKLYHTYAHVGRFADYLRDNGSSDLAPNPSWLIHLQGASRRVDGYCARSRFGSGFGPRVGTNRYDGTNERCLYLDDDLLAITGGTVGVKDQTVGGNTTTLTDETDFIKGPYDTTPYRELRLPYNTFGVWGWADRSNLVTGTWGYSNETIALGTLALADASTTAGTLTGGTAYAGQTLLIGSEQVYVSSTAGTAVGGTALTLVRGVNGTTAAAGTAAASTYVYPEEVTEATLEVAMRRWKGRDAGVSGDYGGGLIPQTGPRDTERSILNAAVSHLRVYSAG